MKKSRYYDKKLRTLLQKKEFDIYFYNYLMKTQAIPFSYKGMIKTFFSKKLVHKTSIRNFCVFTGRPRSVYKLFKVSRIILKQFGSKGLIFGLRKSSW